MHANTHVNLRAMGAAPQDVKISQVCKTSDAYQVHIELVGSLCREILLHRHLQQHQCKSSLSEASAALRRLLLKSVRRRHSRTGLSRPHAPF